MYDINQLPRQKLSKKDLRDLRLNIAIFWVCAIALVIILV